VKTPLRTPLKNQFCNEPSLILKSLVRANEAKYQLLEAPLKIFFSAIFLIFLQSGFAEIGFCQNVDEKLKEEQRELEVLKRRIEKQERTISAVKQKESSVLKTLGRLDDRLKLKKRELKIYYWNKVANEKKIKILSKSVAQTEKKQKRQKQLLVSRLRNIYKEGSMFPIKVMFSAVNFHDLHQRVKYMERMAEHDTRLFQKYSGQLAELQTEKINLLKARKKLARLEENALQKQNEIRGEKTKKAGFIKKLKKEKNLNIQMRKEMVRASQKLNGLISSLQEKLIEEGAIDIADKKGFLKKPVGGKILNKFGKRRDKQYNTFIVYNGINIRSAKGTPVRAVFSGKVLYAGPLDGYGNLVILGHGKEYHSLYGHLDEILAKVGHSIRKDQIIGRSGDTGSLMGETLYFEIRHKGKPVEPVSWFQTAKR
jgi:septal ring factor EnvC (AmiA/AmiB activator)